MLRMQVKSETKGIDKMRKRKNAKMIYLLTQQVLKDSNYFIPKDTGALETSGIVATLKEKEGTVTWDTPYARRLYWNPQFKFRKHKNPNARGLWFEAAKTQFGGDWESIAARAWQ